MEHVLITGASAGIGAAFARRLAAAQENLVLVARRRERLDELAAELEGRHGVSVHAVAADLTRADAVDTIVGRIEASGWGIRGLVNNAGFGDLGRFADLDRQRQLDMVQVNVGAVVDLTHRLIPALRRTPDPFIINVGSLAGFQAGPYMATYYASKAFVLPFSEALHEELRPEGIRVSCLCPGATSSEFADRAGAAGTRLFRLGTMTADEVARIGLARRHRAVVVPGLRNRLTAVLPRLFPRVVTRRAAALLHR